MRTSPPRHQNQLIRYQNMITVLIVASCKRCRLSARLCTTSPRSRCLFHSTQPHSTVASCINLHDINNKSSHCERDILEVCKINIVVFIRSILLSSNSIRYWQRRTIDDECRLCEFVCLFCSSCADSSPSWYVMRTSTSAWNQFNKPFKLNDKQCRIIDSIYCYFIGDSHQWQQ